VLALTACVIALMILRVPIFIAIGLGCLTYFVVHGTPLAMLANQAALSLDSFPLIAIPLFMLAGRLMNVSGVTTRIFRFCHSCVGFIPGGLGHVNVAASVVFAGMSGSALADLGGLGQVEIKAMRDAGYDREFAVGVTMASSILGPIIPPSIAAVIYAINAEVSITGLFLAGILPGLVIAFLQMVFVYIIALRRGFPREAPPRPAQFFRDLLAALPALVTPVLLIGGMTLGVFSPTEAAAMAVCYSLLLGLVVYRELTARDLIRIAIEVGREVAIIMVIVAMGMMFGWILTAEQVPQHMGEFILGLSDSKEVAILLVLVLILFLGCFMEVTVLLLLLPPIFVPSLSELGVDPIHLGIIMIIGIGIGMYTPPFGVGLFAMQKITGLSFAMVARAVLPWLLPLLTGLVVIAYWPWVVLVLPRTFGY
jgi:tripartite ATP-independent transporter DctM subunit